MILQTGRTQDVKLGSYTGWGNLPVSNWCGGGEDIPAGGWRGGGEDIPAGGWRAIIDVYRSVDGLSYFKFSFYPIGDYYEIDILAMPSYGNRDSGLHNTHRLTSGRGGYKICFGDPTVVKTLVAARKWAAYWSEHTLNYIRSGTPFPNS